MKGVRIGQRFLNAKGALCVVESVRAGHVEVEYFDGQYVQREVPAMAVLVSRGGAGALVPVRDLLREYMRVGRDWLAKGGSFKKRCATKGSER